MLKNSNGFAYLRRSLGAVPVLVFSLALTACGSSNSSSGVGASALLGGTIPGTPVSLTGAVTTFAGSTTSGNANGTGLSASFNRPWQITTDGANLYVADNGNNEIRKIQ